VLFDASEVKLHHVARGYAARADGRGKLGSAREGIDRHRGILAPEKIGVRPLFRYV